MKIKLFLILLCILTTIKASATIDYLIVNDITKQLYCAGTDCPAGLIGWRGVGEDYGT